MLLRCIHTDLHLRHPMTHCSIKPQHTCNFLISINSHFKNWWYNRVISCVLGKLWQCNLHLFFLKIIVSYNKNNWVKAKPVIAIFPTLHEKNKQKKKPLKASTNCCPSILTNMQNNKNDRWQNVLHCTDKLKRILFMV